MVGFPSQFANNGQLKTFIKRFLWYNLFHASVNYALSPNFIPLSSSKMYKSTEERKFNVFESHLGGKNVVVSFHFLHECLFSHKEFSDQ